VVISIETSVAEAVAAPLGVNSIGWPWDDFVVACAGRHASLSWAKAARNLRRAALASSGTSRRDCFAGGFSYGSAEFMIGKKRRTQSCGADCERACFWGH